MANINEVVQDQKRAEALGHLSECFAKEYDLTTNQGRQALVEALNEVGKHAAVTCSTATVSLTVGGNGLTGMSLSTTPTPV